MVKNWLCIGKVRFMFGVLRGSTEDKEADEKVRREGREFCVLSTKEKEADENIRSG